jgi:foldase protein PrsA
MDNNLEKKNSSAELENHSNQNHSSEHHAAHHSAEHYVAEHEATHQSEASKKKFRIDLKTSIIISCFIVLGALLFAFKGLFIAAMVNGSPISRFEVISKLETASGKNTLDNIIIEKLINFEAKKQNINVSKDEINTEIGNIEKQVASQGGTLEQALASQNMTMDDLKNQVVVEKELEGLLADKIQVTDNDVKNYIKDNKITIPAGQEATYNDQITQQLKQQKLSAVANDYITSLKSKASINYFVSY